MSGPSDQSPKQHQRIKVFISHDMRFHLLACAVRDELCQLGIDAFVDSLRPLSFAHMPPGSLAIFRDKDQLVRCMTEGNRSADASLNIGHVAPEIEASDVVMLISETRADEGGGRHVCGEIDYAIAARFVHGMRPARLAVHPEFLAGLLADRNLESLARELRRVSMIPPRIFTVSGIRGVFVLLQIVAILACILGAKGVVEKIGFCVMMVPGVVAILGLPRWAKNCLGYLRGEYLGDVTGERLVISNMIAPLSVLPFWVRYLWMLQLTWRYNVLPYAVIVNFCLLAGSALWVIVRVL